MLISFLEFEQQPAPPSHPLMVRTVTETLVLQWLTVVPQSVSWSILDCAELRHISFFVSLSLCNVIIPYLRCYIYLVTFAEVACRS